MIKLFDYLFAYFFLAQRAAWEKRPKNIQRMSDPNDPIPPLSVIALMFAFPLFATATILRRMMNSDFAYIIITLSCVTFYITFVYIRYIKKQNWKNIIKENKIKIIMNDTARIRLFFIWLTIFLFGACLAIYVLYM